MPGGLLTGFPDADNSLWMYRFCLAVANKQMQRGGATNCRAGADSEDAMQIYGFSGKNHSI